MPCGLHPQLRVIADKYSEIAPYTELEIVNCLIHARILLDRLTALSSRFLTGGNRPSFKSFSDHKKFFLKLREPYGEHESHADYVRRGTSWFEMPLKEVRDNCAVHSAPKHMRFVTLLTTSKLNCSFSGLKEFPRKSRLPNLRQSPSTS